MKFGKKAKKTLYIKFHSEPISDERYMKAKVKKNMMQLTHIFQTMKYQKKVFIAFAFQQ